MKIGLLGYGTVGSGAAECLKAHPMDGVEIVRILDGRDIEAVKEILVKDFDVILNDKDIDTVVEVLGGDEPAHTYVKKALEAGKNVVSANKQMLSKNYDELINLAREKGVSIAFSAAAGGSIPWLFNLLRAKRVDNIKSVGGVMNGTTNYILDAMQTGDGADFDVVLKEAQRLGYAEADPTADIDGHDVKAKIALSCDIAFSKMIDPAQIPALGIRYITRRDIAYFRTMGRNCRLMGRAVKAEGGIAAYVEPTLVTNKAEEYNLAGAGNIISYEAEKMGKQAYYGLGAGKEPTGAAIVNDVYDIALGISTFDLAESEGMAQCMPELVSHKYYVRTQCPIDGSLIDEKLAEDVFITKEMTVKEMHDLASSIISGGGEIFAAGIA